MKMYQASYFNRLTKERFIVEMVSGLEEAWDKSVVGYVCKAMNWNINTFCQIKNSIEVTPIELGGNGIFGVEVSFQLKNFQSMKLAPNDWKDIDRVC